MTTNRGELRCLQVIHPWMTDLRLCCYHFTPHSTLALMRALTIGDGLANINIKCSKVHPSPSLNTSSSGDMNTHIATHPSLSTSGLVMVNQSQAASSCEAHAQAPHAAGPATWHCTSDRPVFMVAVLGVFTCITSYSEPNFRGAHIPVPINLHLSKWAKLCHGTEDDLTFSYLT